MTRIIKKIEEKLEDYIKEIKSKNQEAAKSHTFSNFIHDVFNIDSKDMDYEKSVKSEILQVRGRIDAVFGNIIIEFKKDLDQGLPKAKEELLKYFQAYLEESRNNFVGIVNDGIKFKVFIPIIKEGSNRVSDIQEIDELDLEKNTAEQIFLWFDSYFFSESKIIPTSTDIKRRFGLESPTYISIKLQLLELFDIVKDYKPVKIKYESWKKYLEIVYGDKPEELNLFISHTYLSTLVKLIIHLKLSERDKYGNHSIQSILFGDTFTQFGIENFLEEDFFAWIMFIVIRKKSSRLFSKLLSELKIYDLGEINEDVLKELYQEIVDPEIRKQLGEFYTPDWLAEDMVVKTLDDKPESSILDPSCGSGTFLFKSIRYKITE